jgi:uncharacterized protein with von Willebrand factor type A (vWA) domain
MAAEAGTAAATPDQAGGLVDRHVSFMAALRRVGLPVSMAESLDAGRAITAVDLLDRDQMRAAYAATVVKHPAHRPAFDRLFDLWWPSAIGDGDEDADSDASGELDEADPADLDGMRNELRDRLRDVLLSGDDEALRRLAREAVNGLGRAEGGQPGRQSWFTYRVLRALNPDTLMASLLEQVLLGKDRGGLAEKVARQMITERMRQFEELVESEVRRRLAEERGAETVAKTAVKPLVDQVEFLRASRDDLAALRREVHPIARRLATRLTARRRLGRSGRLDVRRTVRACPPAGCRSPRSSSHTSRTSPSWSYCATSAAPLPPSRTSRCCCRSRCASSSRRSASSPSSTPPTR